MKLIKMSDESNSNLYIMPVDMLNNVLQGDDIKKATSAMVILLDRSIPNKYSTLYFASRLTTDEMISLCMDTIRTIQDYMRGIVHES